eukprot:TRINITY_DN6567_c0_g1_i1.p1 TRINITY_DN6567_c0_g1~~TRINITY_DN6567_c0_g1_i1.p1  ORF type:complete len:380 (+),score=103.20 TRINITY_DN6567_c0_g1_i1:106-1245(+)
MAAMITLTRRCTSTSRAVKPILRAYSTMEPEVTTAIHQAAAIATLNRPKALNALTLNMVNLLRAFAKDVEANDAVKVAVLEGAGGKAFCAGGDVVQVAKSAKHEIDDGELARAFFHDEYEVDYDLATLSKPLVSLIHGITMGGGVGISVHGTYRVATERTLFAMPETAIGLFPDVGGSHFLPRLSMGGTQGPLGMFLALTGHRLKGEQVYHAGVATHYVNSEDLPKLKEDLAAVTDSEAVGTVLDKYHQKHQDAPFFADIQGEIEACFGQSSLQACMDAMEASEWGQQQLKIINDMSPLSVAVTFEQLQRGASLDLKQCLEMEYGMTQHFMAGDDFYNGVRAKLIEKGAPVTWQHASVADVTDEEVQAYFSPTEYKLTL